MTFTNRSHAGRLLATSLAAYRDRPDVIVLALARGGVLVGCEVALNLHVPLDVLVVRKIGLPGFPEMAVGALAPDGVQIISEKTAARFGIAPEVLRQVVESETEELRRRTARFRADRSYPDLHEKVVLLVDDGLATGRTMAAAISWARQRGAQRIVAAAPVGAADTCRALAKTADQVVCPNAPSDFAAVGSAYDDFHQVTDDEVVAALQRAAEESAAASPPVQANGHSLHPARRLSCEIPLVKTAKIKLSKPQSAEISLSNGRVIRIKGEAAREPINAITSAKNSPDYHATFGLPLEDGRTLVVGVDGSQLETMFKN